MPDPITIAAILSAAKATAMSGGSEKVLSGISGKLNEYSREVSTGVRGMAQDIVSGRFSFTNPFKRKDLPGLSSIAERAKKRREGYKSSGVDAKSTGAKKSGPTGSVMEQIVKATKTYVETQGINLSPKKNGRDEPMNGGSRWINRRQREEEERKKLEDLKRRRTGGDLMDLLTEYWWILAIVAGLFILPKLVRGFNRPVRRRRRKNNPGHGNPGHRIRRTTKSVSNARAKTKSRSSFAARAKRVNREWKKAKAAGSKIGRKAAWARWG